MNKLTGIYFKQYNDYASVLRFYDDNSVVEISSSAQISDTVIYKEISYGSLGSYEIYDTNKIKFSVKNSNGSVDYIGTILDNKNLNLKSRSNINGYESENIYRLYEQVPPKPIQPKESESQQLINNWKKILKAYAESYPIEKIYISDSENILVLKDNNSTTSNPPVFVIAYLHLYNGSPFWLYNEINKFVDELKSLSKENEWDVFEYRMILNFSLGQLANSGIKQIPRDVKYYKIESDEELNLTLQDFILESITSNNHSHKVLKEGFAKLGRRNKSARGSSYWTCNVCDGDSDSGCLYFDPTECPRNS